jgi:hypothetical protein
MQIMSSYTDLLEAVHLVKNINSAAKHINSMKLNCVPRHGVMKKIGVLNNVLLYTMP